MSSVASFPSSNGDDVAAAEGEARPVSGREARVTRICGVVRQARQERHADADPE